MALAAASRTQLNALLETADHQKLIIPAFMISILRHTDFCDHPAVDDLDIPFYSGLGQWENKTQYAQSIRDLAEKDNGWHFSARNTSAAQLQNFRIEDMAKNMKSLAPELWDLLGLLLSANRQTMEVDEDDPMETDLPEDDPTRRAQKLAERREGLITIKKVVMISVLMQSTNKNCNALESVFGIFLHASNTPSKVIEALAHMGISISTDTIENAVHSLSR
ncbi:hypothetical protein B0H16DRAFT_1842618 [Mycena metata]|uniref:Uncharacterized protein n=1 Tax=Mycena metata TaxID=1033252 RepID=A0AAD7IVC0_9AGAR|nr:hypothetical protein B0H16DRAFT_1842618 [Mycena metata]